MSVVETAYKLEYPESDGLPTGETELHVYWSMRLRDIFKFRYRGQRVYVGANMFLYYVEGQPFWNVCPDLFVVLDCDPRMRDVFKTWEDDRVPTAVFEITSQHTSREDQIHKPLRYQHIGIQDYVLYDPRAEYLRPPLQVIRLTPTTFEPVEPNNRGQLERRSLGITLELDGRDLLLRDAQTGEILPTESEAEEELRKAAEEQRKAAEAERDAALARNAELEAELQRLRASQDNDPTAP